MTDAINSWEIPTEPYVEDMMDKWDFCPDALENESFLSWFTRLAKENCSDARLLYQQLMNGSAIRNLKLKRYEKELESIQTDKKKLKLLVETLKPFITIEFEKIYSISVPLHKSNNQWDFLNTPLNFPNFCPDCLKNDKIPYFRKNWFLKPYTVCQIHRCLLLKNCPHCNSFIKFWKTDWDEKITYCYNCHQDISKNIDGVLYLQDIEFHNTIKSICEERKFNKYFINKTYFFRQLWKLVCNEQPNSLIQISQIDEKILPVEVIFRVILFGLKILEKDPERLNNPLMEKNDGFNPMQDERVLERLEILDPLFDLGYPTMRDFKEYGETVKYSWRTLYRWFRSYQKSGITGLIPQYNKSGRRLKKFSVDFENYLDKMVYNYALSSEEKNMTAFFRKCSEKANIMGLPKGTLTYSLLYRRVQVAREKIRLGKTNEDGD